MRLENFYFSLLFLLSCAAQPEPYTQVGEASYYADHFTGSATASGALYHPDSLTAAHPFLPLGSQIKVINLENEKEVLVTVNDRGPFGSPDRIVDLSKAAARELDFIEAGLAQVKLIVKTPAEGYQVSDSIASGRR